MNVILFLELPIDIRKEVYYHLDGNFCGIGSTSVEQLYCSNFVQLPSSKYKKNERQRLLGKRLYHLFSPFIGIFDYSPSLIDEWLDYSLWLRYDCIVLDCMRLNHTYGGSLIGPMDWVYLDNRLRLAYFKNCMLQVWYTFREYTRWIVDEEGEEESINYLRLNLEYFKCTPVEKISTLLKRNEIFLFLNHILFDQESDGETEDQIIDNNGEEMSYQLTNMPIIKVVNNMEAMKKLDKISVRGAHLYQSLINFHGVRDNPGKTINYLVKKRILHIELLQIDDLTRSSLSDLTRWENLRELCLGNIEEIDLNRLVLPNSCQNITIKNASRVIWWKLEIDLEDMTKYTFTTKKLNIYTTAKAIDRQSVDPDIFGQLQALVWRTLKPLNFIKLQCVHEIPGGRIVIPKTLYDNKRFLIYPMTNAIQEIIIV